MQINQDDLKRNSALISCKLWNHGLDVVIIIDAIYDITDSFELDRNKLLPIVTNDVVDYKNSFKQLTNTVDMDVFTCYANFDGM